MTAIKLQPHRDAVAAALDAGETYSAIADRFGVGEASVRRFVKSEKLERKQPTLAITEPDAPIDETEKLRHQLRQAQQAATKTRSLDVQAELLLDEIRNTVVPADPIYEAPAEAEGAGHPHAHLLLLSDWHIGEIVDREAMNGINEYNWVIAKDRLNQVQRSLRSFQNARPYPIDEIVIGLLGDMNGGTNHQELAETNEFPIAEQCYRTGQAIGQFIEPLVEDYPSIRVIGVAGNHPRVPAKPANKQVFNNFDWLSYKYAEAYLSKYPHITFDLPRSGYHVAPVAGKSVLFFHGDGIKSTMPGVPWGGLIRRLNELRKQFAEVGTIIDYAVCGHFHQACIVPGAAINGSLKGPDEYTLKNFGGGEQPTQLLFTFDKTKERLTDVSFITPA